MKNGKIKRPAGVPAQDWEDLLLDLEEYRDREIDGIYTEANEMSQSIAEKCIRLFLPTAGSGREAAPPGEKSAEG